MALLFDLLALPVLGPPKLVSWLANTIATEIAQQSNDTGSVRSQLLDLYLEYEAGQIGEEEYEQQEKVLLDRLNTMNEQKGIGTT